jgi:preprotein translocase subunit SecG
LPDFTEKFMGFVIGLLTAVMVLDCVILVLLVLIQLPKKDAGAGLAFGGGATDALFGAGSGTVLTRITKYAAIAFFVLSLLLSILHSNYHRSSAVDFEKRLTGPAPLATPPPSKPSQNPSATASGTPAATTTTTTTTTTTSNAPVLLTAPADDAATPRFPTAQTNSVAPK